MISTLTRNVSKFGATALLPFLLGSPLSAHGQTVNYPNKTIKFVVPYTPGGSNDVVARVLGQKLSTYWGQSVVVDNISGAGGNVGAAYVARAAADGYTLLITPNNLLTMNPYVYKKNGVGYDPIKDFAPISLVATGAIMLAVNAHLPVNSVTDLIAYMKANPGKLGYGSAGVGTPHHLTAVMFQSMAGGDMTHIAYRGASPAVNDLVAGRIDLMFGIPNSLMPFVKTGQLKALGISSDEKDPYLPDVPTISSSGLPGFNSTLWIGLVAPAGTPKAILDKINAGIAKAMSEDDVKATLKEQGLHAAFSSSGEFSELVKKDASRWSKLIEEKGVTAD
jgi:tripartite-type tricarboxylate transporter receptor subunit TctC